MFDIHRTIMRKDIDWTPEYEPQVGDQVTLADGSVVTVAEYTGCARRGIPFLPDDFKAYARALGKVSRVVEVPEGYRLEDDPEYVLRYEDMILFDGDSRWSKVWGLSGHKVSRWASIIAVAIPTTAQDSCTQTSKLPEIEGEVVGMGIASLTVACRLTESMRFRVGTRVRIRIEEVQG